MGTKSSCLLFFFSLLLSGALRADSDRQDWIEGHWCFSSDGKQVEEYWLAPQAGETVGLGRTTSGGEMTSFEYLRIAGTESKRQYIAQPSGAAPTAFDATSSGPGWIVFENTQHDFPQRIEYRREGDSLTAIVSGPGEGGEEMAFTINYTRCH